jgi:hypothetical protein
MAGGQRPALSRLDRQRVRRVGAMARRWLGASPPAAPGTAAEEPSRIPAGCFRPAAGLACATARRHERTGRGAGAMAAAVSATSTSSTDQRPSRPDPGVAVRRCDQRRIGRQQVEHGDDRRHPGGEGGGLSRWSGQLSTAEDSAVTNGSSGVWAIGLPSSTSRYRSGGTGWYRRAPSASASRTHSRPVPRPRRHHASYAQRAAGATPRSERAHSDAVLVVLACPSTGY